MIKDYIRNRFYLRGITPLGLFNTLTAFLFNRVLVRHVDNDSGKTLYVTIQKATDFKGYKKGTIYLK